MFQVLQPTTYSRMPPMNDTEDEYWSGESDQLYNKNGNLRMLLMNDLDDEYLSGNSNTLYSNNDNVRMPLINDI